MTPAARNAAVIEILELAEKGGTSVNRIINSYLRMRRYAGAKDRSAIYNRVYGVIRCRFRIDWWLKQINVEPNSRTRLIAGLAFLGKKTGEITEEFSGKSLYGPAGLTKTETAAYYTLSKKSLFSDTMPKHIYFECPDWIASRLASTFSSHYESCLSCLKEEASFDLRLNPIRKLKQDSVIKSLSAFGLETRKTPYSPLGLRSESKLRIEGTELFKTGAIEIQDEGAQLAALLVGVAPGMQVADFCAGVGGKTLIMAALMANKGRVLAMDVSRSRLNKAANRISRAGLHNVERKVLTNSNHHLLKRLSKRFDRVLVDVPCTGTGTWRRNPDLRFRYEENDLLSIIKVQDNILRNAARLTKPGGRLVYVTCSLLWEENQERVFKFIKQRPDYYQIPIKDVWRETVSALGGGVCPTADKTLRLTPDQHGTDGFFVAVLGRKR